MHYRRALLCFVIKLVYVDMLKMLLRHQVTHIQVHQSVSLTFCGNSLQ